MDKPVSAAIVLALLAVLLLLMVLGWRARGRRQRGLAAVPRPPADIGTTIASFDVFYVATTLANEPLNRVVVGGLGFRGRATVDVTESGIILSIAGEKPVFIAVEALRSVSRATWTIDRVVEDGGLVLVGWTLGDSPAGSPESTTDLDSSFRLHDSDALIAAIEHLLPTPTGSTTP